MTEISASGSSDAGKRDEITSTLQDSTQIGPWDTGNISFDHNIRATAQAKLTLYSSGAYSFEGRFHNPDLVPYDVSFGWVVVDKSGTAFVFSTKGKVAGSITPGSQNYSWDNHDTNPAISAAWPQLEINPNWKWQADISADIDELIKDIMNALKTAGTIISTVIMVVG